MSGKKYIIDMTNQEITKEAIENIKKDGVEGYGVELKLSKGGYKNPPMKAKVIVEYSNITFIGHFRCVWNYTYDYLVTIVYNDYKLPEQGENNE